MTSDPTTWPVVECEPADVFLGTFDYDCLPALTPAQSGWPTAECSPAGEPRPAAPVAYPSPPAS